MDLYDHIAEQARTQELYRGVFGTREGQAVLEHLLRACGAFSATYVQGDTHQTAFREGQRNVALSIVRLIERDDVRLAAEMMRTRNENIRTTEIQPGGQ